MLSKFFDTHEKRRFLSLPAVAARFWVKNVFDANEVKGHGIDLAPLTKRERGVMELYLEGLTGREFASRLGESLSTYSGQKTSDLAKLGAGLLTGLFVKKPTNHFSRF
jgi:DNA-binding CsgD family transcriptional regulator